MKANPLVMTAAAAAALTVPLCADAASDASSSESSAQTGYVSVSSLHVRSGPSTSASVLGSLPKHTPVQILSTTGDWHRISYHNQTAYIYAAYVSSIIPDESAYTVSVEALNVRSGPSLSSEVINIVKRGTVVAVQGEENGWYRIFYNGALRYVKKDYVTKAADSVQAASSDYYVNCSALRVRSGPTTSSDVIGILRGGDKVQVLGDNGDWYKIRYSGRDAFIAKQYVQTTSGQAAATQANALFQVPAQGTLTSGFGMRQGVMHYGIDIAKAGVVPITAAAAGTVTRSYYSTTYGNVVFLSHTINGQLYTTVYAHMRSRAVAAGASVKAGQLLGYMGNTGHSYGQHLHFELYKGAWDKANAVDPMPYLKF